MPPKKDTADSALPRITGEMILENQLRLEEWIEKLIKENRTLKDEEHLQFTRIYRRATLGLGSFVRLATGELPGADSATLDEMVLIYMMKPKMKKFRVGWADSDEKWQVEPKHLWQAILTRLKINVFGEALQTGWRMSPERFQYTPEEFERV